MQFLTLSAPNKNCVSRILTVAKVARLEISLIRFITFNRRKLGAGRYSDLRYSDCDYVNNESSAVVAWRPLVLELESKKSKVRVFI